MSKGVLGRLGDTAGDLSLAWKKAHSLGDFARLGLDQLLQKRALFKAYTSIFPGARNRLRRVRMKDGTVLNYRLNRGDIWTVREVWLHDIYELPRPIAPKSYIDLGCNIGLTLLWFCRKYKPEVAVGVEPSPQNMDVARRNARDNGLNVRFYQAAVAPQDGELFFSDCDESNMGHLSDKGRRVEAVSMETILRDTVNGHEVDLLKMDIEGGEEPLLAGDVSWLARVRNMVVEFHPETIDYPLTVQRVRNTGMEYVAPGSAGYQNMEFFFRPDSKVVRS